ncbi:MMPL family transporter [Actinoplanes sp. NPDC051861]|uniref:MMPL family transporter n=1 Tax=Actinoplanes sp. NPDC051861 TaxID=3155170 RepID=UPI00341BD563
MSGTVHPVSSGQQRERVHRAFAAIGRRSVRHRWATVVTWLLVTVAVAALVVTFGRPVDDDTTLPGSNAQHGRDLLEQYFPGTDGASGTVILRSAAGPLDDAAVRATAARIDAIEHIASVALPQASAGSLSADGRTGYLTVQFDISPRDVDQALIAEVMSAAEQTATAGVEVLPGGTLARSEADTRRSEALGLAVALVVLVLAFGGLVAAGLPLLTALLTLVCGLGAIGLAGHLTPMPGVATTVATMIGLGVGIDYALFLVTRYRTLIATGSTRPTGSLRSEAIVATVASSGSAVAFAGGTVIIALAGLFVSGVPILGTLAWTAALVVLVAVAAAVTLLPALLALLGPRVDALRIGRSRTPSPAASASTSQGDVSLASVSQGDAAQTDVSQTSAAQPDAAQTDVFQTSAAQTSAAQPDAAQTDVSEERFSQDKRSQGNGGGIGDDGCIGAGDSGEWDAGEVGGDRASWSVWGRLADRVTRRPLRYAVAATALLLLMAAPVVTMELGQSDAGDWPAGTEARAGYDVLAEEFGPGVNGPLTVVAELSPAALPPRPAPAGESAGTSAPPDERVTALVAAIEAVPGVERMRPPRLSEDGGAVSMRVIPETGPGDERTASTIARLREVRAGGTAVAVTGPVPMKAELAERVGARMPYVIGLVVLLAGLLVLAAFRAPVVAAKAALMNLFSVAAAYGVLTAVFQWGWGAGLIGLDGPVPIESYVPMMLFALLFGLSMDYEVFLLTAVRESWEVSGDNRRSVREGLAGTGVVITSAALIMVCVFASFVLSASPVVKMMGLGLAVAVAIDATVIRGVLVPATMALLGRANWWVPGRGRTPAGDGRA